MAEEFFDPFAHLQPVQKDYSKEQSNIDFFKGQRESFAPQNEIFREDYSQAVDASYDFTQEVKGKIANYDNAFNELDNTYKQAESVVAKEFGAKKTAGVSEAQKIGYAENKMDLSFQLSQLSSQVSRQKLDKSIKKFSYDFDLFKSYDTMLKQEKMFYDALAQNQRDFDAELAQKEAAAESEMMGSIFGAIGTVAGFVAGGPLGASAGGVVGKNTGKVLS